MSTDWTEKSISRAQAKWRHKAIWIGLFAVAAILAWPLVKSLREASQHQGCRANLAQIAHALQSYQERHGSFPPAYVVGGNGERWHSWRVLLLPFLGRDDLFHEYRFDEPWNGPNNRILASKMPDVYACPGAAGRDRGIANYLAVVGRATAWPEQHAVRPTDFHDGTSNSIQLMESADSDILWLEPRDLTHLQALGSDKSVRQPTFSSRHTSTHVALADGNVRSLALNHIDRKIFASLMTISAGRPLAGIDWPPERVFGLAELPPPRPAEELPNTDVLPYPDGPIVPGRNYLYCATMAIVWDGFRQSVGGGAVQLEGNPPLADALNRHVFQRSNLSADSYVARSGSIADGIVSNIRDEIAAKFPSAEPHLLDRVEGNAILMYAYLQKLLPFRTEFDVLEKPMHFSTGNTSAPVKGFGIEHFEDHGHRDELIKSQVTILDYVNDDDFIIRLENTTARDRIVLAKVPPEKSLAGTIDAVRRREIRPVTKHVEPKLKAGESLQVPMITASVTRSFPELAGRRIQNSGWSGGYVAGAWQVIRFRLDEAGVRLESEAALVGEFGDDVSSRIRRLILDRPFLLYLIERDADQPYFATWIENAELLERWEVNALSR